VSASTAVSICAGSNRSDLLFSPSLGLFQDSRDQQTQSGITTTEDLTGWWWEFRLTTNPLRSNSAHWFNGGASYLPGHYLISCRGNYNNAVIMPGWMDWRIASKLAWDDYGNLGMAVRYTDLDGSLLRSLREEKGVFPVFSYFLPRRREKSFPNLSNKLPVRILNI